MSSTGTTTATFNRSNARRVASKMAADLRRMQQQYDGWPSDHKIGQLVEEVTELLALDYMDTLEIGYARNGKRVLSLMYQSRRDGTLHVDDNAGGLPRGVDISGCERFNFMTYTLSFLLLSADERLAVEEKLPYIRTSAEPPADGDGVWVRDKTYSSSGGGTERSTFKPSGS